MPYKSYTPTGIPHNFVPSPWESCDICFYPQQQPHNISFHARGIPAGSEGFPRSPSPCRPLVHTMHLLAAWQPQQYCNWKHSAHHYTAILLHSIRLHTNKLSQQTESETVWSNLHSLISSVGKDAQRTKPRRRYVSQHDILQHSNNFWQTFAIIFLEILENDESFCSLLVTNV